MVLRIYLLIISLASTSAFGGFGERYPENLWVDGKVYYMPPDAPFHASTHRNFAFIKRVMDDFSNQTKGRITFLPASDYRPSAIRFVPLENFNRPDIDLVSGAVNAIGRYPGIRDVMLKADADAVTIMHELMHVLGFHHEHQRSDAGDVLDIALNSEDTFGVHNFETIPGALQPEEDALKYDLKRPYKMYTPYDVNSIMHYASAAAELRGHRMVRRYDGKDIPRPTGLSVMDLEAIARMYDEKVKPLFNNFLFKIAGIYTVETVPEKPRPKGGFFLNLGGSSEEKHYILDEGNGVKHTIGKNRFLEGREGKYIIAYGDMGYKTPNGVQHLKLPEVVQISTGDKKWDCYQLKRLFWTTRHELATLEQLQSGMIKDREGDSRRSREEDAITVRQGEEYVPEKCST